MWCCIVWQKFNDVPGNLLLPSTVWWKFQQISTMLLSTTSNVQCHYCESGPGSVVGTVTGYGLDSPGIESWWGVRFSTPVQTSPGAPPASCTMGTRSFPRVKSGRGITLTPHPLLVPWSRKGRAIPLLPLYGLYRAPVPVQGCTLPLLFITVKTSNFT